MDHCPGGELLFHLAKEDQFTENKARFYAANVLIALEELHKHDILYRE
jgi:serine/threonine protein kinase